MTDKPHRILVVDDIKDWRLTLSNILEDAGYVVSAAGSANEALQTLAEDRFDLAVLDIRLDEREEGNTAGIDLATEIKRQWPQVKIVLITGYGTRDTVHEAFVPEGAAQPLVENYVPKAETETLPEIVRQALKQ